MANNVLTTLETLKSILPVVETNIIKKVKDASPKIAEPVDDDIPTIFISGAIPDSKNYVAGELEYVSKTTKFHAYTYIKLQGASTLALPKKNYTVNLYSDENRNIKFNKEFKNWGFHNNFVLKADYNDILHARNVVGAKLWGKVVASRPDYDTLPEELRNSPNNGAIDGFPVKVYVDGKYNGLYNWTIPKCDWMLGMNEKNENHAVLSAEINDNGDSKLQFNPCNFNSPWLEDNYNDAWSIEVGKAEQSVIRSSWNEMYISLSELPENLTSYLDIQSAIDYFIFQEIILGTDGLAKNMLLATYDMTKWYLSAYDMDSTFDLDWNGEILGWYNSDMPSTPYNNQYSSLLTYIQNNYHNAYIERYTELRKSVLSYSSIIEEFEKHIGIFGEDVYIKDTAIYPDIPSVTPNTLESLRKFVKDRLEYLDNKYEAVI